jgi:PIN domain-containing protein
VPTYFVDASVQIDVAKALAQVRDDILYPGALGSPIASPNVDDIDWLPAVGAHDYVLLKRDKKIRTRPWERQALFQAGIRAFCLTGAGNYSKWETLRLWHASGPTWKQSLRRFRDRSTQSRRQAFALSRPHRVVGEHRNARVFANVPRATNLG